jgi:acetyl-CoA acetyltransferase
MAVATGVAKYVVVYRAFNERSGRRYSTGIGEGIVTADLIHWSWYLPFGLLTPASWVAMFSNRYMHEYGLSSEDLAHVAVSTRKHAVNNPNAFFYGKELTMEEHQASRYIAEPLRLFDCCQESDGGCAQVITTPERARDLKKKAAVIRGVAEAAARGQENMTSFYRPKISYLPEKDSTRSRACGPTTSTPRSSTTRLRRSCSGSSNRTASASAASRPRSCVTAIWSWAGACRATPTAGSSARRTFTA